MDPKEPTFSRAPYYDFLIQVPDNEKVGYLGGSNVRT